MTDNDELQRAFGRIEGLLEGIQKGVADNGKRIDKQDEKLEKLDGRFDSRIQKHDARLRSVEKKAAVWSVASAGVISVLVAFLRDKLWG